ncbi:TolC family protein, partial [Acidithiobacillus sp. MC6.1]|nr:TolC family protein [Acidithiobacillus sp. MC6.1]
ALTGARLAYIVAERDQLNAQIQAQQALGALENAVQQPLAVSSLRVASHSL